MSILHYEAVGLTISTLMLFSVLLASHRSHYVMAALALFTASVLFAAVTAWFCLFNPATTPHIVVHYATTASWWILPVLVGVVLVINYQAASALEQRIIRNRIGAVLLLSLLVVGALLLLSSLV